MSFLCENLSNHSKNSGWQVKVLVLEKRRLEVGSTLGGGGDLLPNHHLPDHKFSEPSVQGCRMQVTNTKANQQTSQAPQARTRHMAGVPNDTPGGLRLAVVQFRNGARGQCAAEVLPAVAEGGVLRGGRGCAGISCLNMAWPK